MRRVRSVELPDHDSVLPPAGLFHDRAIRFDPLDVSESGQRIEQQPGTTADVENPDIARAGEHRLDFGEYNLLTDAPPPVSSVQFRVGGGVVSFHYSPPTIR